MLSWHSSSAARSAMYSRTTTADASSGTSTHSASPSSVAEGFALASTSSKLLSVASGRSVSDT